jgi:hypothetical protein
MRFPLSLRAARACATATLILSLGLAPSYAHMGEGPGPAARPSLGFGHSARFLPHGFDRRFAAGRSGFNRFGRNGFGRFGFDRFNRFGFDRYGWNPLFGGGGWGGWGGFPASEPSEPILVVGGGAPVIINIGADPGPGDVASASSGGCVIHKLNYDSNGKYVDERQIPQC